MGPTDFTPSPPGRIAMRTPDPSLTPEQTADAERI
jgi:hypothetical protein